MYLQNEMWKEPLDLYFYFDSTPPPKKKKSLDLYLGLNQLICPRGRKSRSNTIFFSSVLGGGKKLKRESQSQSIWEKTIDFYQ